MKKMQPPLQRWHGLMYFIIITVTTLVSKAQTNPCRHVNVTHRQSAGDACFFVPTGALTWQLAKQECRAQQSHLAVVNSTTNMAVVSKLMESAHLSDVWIGASEENLGWTWSDGRALQGSLTNYPWGNVPDVTSTRQQRTNCVSMESSLTWHLHGCGTTKGFICQFGRNHPNCSENAQIVKSGTWCFLFKLGSHSWFRSRRQCDRLGGKLAEPETTRDQGALAAEVGAIQRSGSRTFWIGLRRSTWQWNTGDEVKLTFWEHSEPEGVGTCVKVHTFMANSLYLWQSAACSDRLPFVCQTGDTNGDTVIRPPNNPATDSNLRNILVGLLVVLAIVLGLIMLFMFVYHRRGRALRRDAREQAKVFRVERASQPRASPNNTDYAIFTCERSGIREASRKHPTPSASSGPNGRLPPINRYTAMGCENGQNAGISAIQEGQLPRNNSLEVPRLNLEDSTTRRKGTASKYQAEYDVDNDQSVGQNSIDSEDLFRNITGFDSPLSDHQDEAGYEVPQALDAYTDGALHSKRKQRMAFYKTDAIHEGVKIPEPVSDSMVMESFQAEEPCSKDDDVGLYETLISHTPDQVKGHTTQVPNQEDGSDSNRSKYIEDVAKAFDFLVSGDRAPDAQNISAPKTDNMGVNGKLLKRREKRNGDQDRVVKTHSKIPIASVNSSDSSKTDRGLYGEKGRDGSLSKRKKHTDKTKNGQANGAFVEDKTGMDEKLSQRSTKIDRRERDKKVNHEVGDNIVDENANGLTRVGSPTTLGQLPPLNPSTDNDTNIHHKKHPRRKGPLRHRDGRLVTEEEMEARRLRHVRKREKERRRKERENRACATQIEVRGRPCVEDEAPTDDTQEDSLDSDDSYEDSYEHSHLTTNLFTPTKNAPPQRKTPKGERKVGDNHSDDTLVYDIDSFGAGQGVDV